MKIAAPGSKWSRRTTKYVSVRVEVGSYARLSAIARQFGETRGAAIVRVLDYYDAGVLQLKKESIPASAKVVPVSFEEEL